MLSQLPAICETTRVVLELSSWQLEAFVPHTYSPPLAVVTNVLPDHLNRYAGMDDYAAAKEIMVRYQGSDDVAVLNRGNAYTRQFGARAPGKVVWFSDQVMIPGEAESPVRGAHQRENMAAALAAARVWGVGDAAIASVVQNFTGVPHRQELVREWRGIRFINDTTATMPTATVACIESVPGPKILLLGGADKNLDFTGLKQALRVHQDADSRYCALGRQRHGPAGRKLAAARRGPLCRPGRGAHAGRRARPQRRRGNPLAGLRFFRHVPTRVRARRGLPRVGCRLAGVIGLHRNRFEA